jgi:undecaprenyl-diphosphatase
VSLAAAILLGIIQGFTEFLPVSSSAHLILARAFFGWEMPPDFGLAFDVALHVGTLAAILAFFREEIIGMVRALPMAFAADPGPSGRLMRLIAVGTLPVVVVGLTLSDVIEETLRTPAVTAVTLTLGAIGMLVAERIGPRIRDERGITFPESLWIGCAQASALVPGMSRSGSTITIGMFLGIRRDAAARFTFLLAIPAMIAAAAKEGIEMIGMPLAPGSLQTIVAGTITSAVVGYVTIKYFLRFLAGNRLDVFAYYRLLLAAATVVWLLREQTP